MPIVVEDARRIFVLYTGGTIGMMKNDNEVFVPITGVFLSKLRYDDELNDLRDPEWTTVSKFEENFVLPECGKCCPKITYRVREYQRLVDSSNMSPDNWVTIARDIGNEYENYDGFVILHGTDTLAYTASALSFMLRGIQKPIVLTGAQISIFVPGSDAKNNFLSALRFAANKDIKEVCVCFANKLLRGNRSIKQSSEGLEAFTTPNYDVLAEVFHDLTVNKHLMWQSKEVAPIFTFHLEKDVVILRIFPTMSSKMLQYVLKPPTKGVVLLTYGAGNIPTRPEFFEIMKEAVDRGVLIVNITQCIRGAVHPLYEPGEALHEIGVLPGYDMTVEAAFAKLTYVLGQRCLSPAQKKEMMKTNICGELSEA